MRRALAAIWLILTLHCDESTRLVSNQFDGEPLSRAERWAVRFHELCCRPCRRFRQQVLLLQRAAQELARRDNSSSETIPEEARQRIKAHLRQARQQ